MSITFDSVMRTMIGDREQAIFLGTIAAVLVFIFVSSFVCYWIEEWSEKRRTKRIEAITADNEKLAQTSDKWANIGTQFEVD